MPGVFDGYVRVSKVGKRKGDSFISPEQQRKKIEAWAKENGVTIRKPWVEDLDKSGSNMNRPGFQGIMERIEHGEVEGIIVAKLDRWARTIYGGLREMQRVQEAGGKVVILDLDVDTTKPDGEFQLQIRLSVAELEWKNRRDSFDEAKRQAVAKGIHLSSVPPSGYLKNPETRRLEPDPHDGTLIGEAFKMRAAGTTKGEIADFLNREGCIGSRYNEDGEREPIHWRASILHRIFANPVYLGQARSGKYVLENAHPALIDRATWEAAQAAPRLDKPGKDQGHLLRGLIRCQGCRRVLTPDSMQDRDGTRIPMYRCRGKHSCGDCEQRAAVLARLIDPLIERYFWKYAEEKVLVPSLDSSELETAELAVTEAEADRKAWQKLNIAKIGEAVFQEGLDERVDREQRAQATLGEVRARSQHPKLGDLASLKEVWPSLEVAEKRCLLSTVIGTVILRKGHAPIEDRIMIFPRGTEPADELPRRGRSFPVVEFPFAVAA